MQPDNEVDWGSQELQRYRCKVDHGIDEADGGTTDGEEEMTWLLCFLLQWYWLPFLCLLLSPS
jgi:hypothetical protein